MRGPAARHTQDEIVGFIMAALETNDATVREQVVALLGQVGALDPDHPTIGNRKINEEYARKLRKWVDDGERLLRSLPESFDVSLLFAPETGPPRSPEHVEVMDQQTTANYQRLRTALATLHDRCSLIIRSHIGEHGSAGWRQDQAARAARELSTFAGQPLAWSSPTSAYRKITSYFYEAMTGLSGEDMERACRRNADPDRKS
jgi:hypothetical protein